VRVPKLRCHSTLLRTLFVLSVSQTKQKKLSFSIFFLFFLAFFLSSFFSFSSCLLSFFYLHTHPHLSLLTSSSFSLPSFLLCSAETFEKKQINQMIWSPRGQFIVLAGLGAPMNGQLEFWNAKDQELMGTGEHFMCTDIEWDPTGRYVVSSVSAWKERVSFSITFSSSSFFFCLFLLFSSVVFFFFFCLCFFPCLISYSFVYFSFKDRDWLQHLGLQRQDASQGRFWQLLPSSLAPSPRCAAPQGQGERHQEEPAEILCVV